MKISYNLFRSSLLGTLLIFSVLLSCFDEAKAQPYLMNTNTYGGPQNAGGVSVYNLSAPPGTAPAFYDHGVTLTGEPGQYSALFKASDGMIYGHTEDGGEHGVGVFYKLNPQTGEVEQLFDFDQDGYQPVYGMVEHNGYIWGTMRKHHSSGARIFAVELANPTRIKQTYDLGIHLQIKRIGGSLLLLNGKMYGTIFDAQDNAKGRLGGVYEFDPSTFQSRVVGEVPYPLLYASGDLSYRDSNGDMRIVACATEGTFIHGGLFEVSINSGYTHEIARSSDKGFTGDKFSGVFRNSNGDFYTRSFYGGSEGVGTLINSDGSKGSFSKEWTFSRAAGQPSSVLLPYGHDMIGMTIPTGTGGNGVIYKIDRNGTYYELYKFDDDNARWPSNHFIIDGDMLYGIAVFGGASNEGVLFKYDLANNKYEKINDFGSDTGFHPEMRMSYWKDGKYVFSNSRGGVENKGTLATFDPTIGEIGHLYSSREFSGNAEFGYANAPFLASNGKYYAIERTRSTNLDLNTKILYRNRIVQFNDELDSVVYWTNLFGTGLWELVERDQEYAVISDLTEINGLLVFTIKSKLYTFDPVTWVVTPLFDLFEIHPGIGAQFSTKINDAGNGIYYLSTQGGRQEEGGTILQLDTTNPTWTLTKVCDITYFAKTDLQKYITLGRKTGKGGVGIVGNIVILPGSNSDPDTLVAAMAINSPTTLGSVFKYPLGDNGNVIDEQHLIYQFPNSRFQIGNNTSANDSTVGWYPESDIVLRDRKIYGFNKGGFMNYVPRGQGLFGDEEGTDAYRGTFWSIDLDADTTGGQNLSLLFTLDSIHGATPKTVNPIIVDLKPITGKKVDVDTLGCAIITKTFKVEGHNRGTLNWEYPTNLTEVARNADSIVLDFSQIPTTVETTSTIKVWAANPGAKAGYRSGDTLEWNIHQYVQPTIGDIQTSVDLNCPTKHAELTLSSYSHVDSFYWELPTDIVLLDPSSNRDNIQIDVSAEQFGAHEIVCHAFNGCGNVVTDTIRFNLVDLNVKPAITASSTSTICSGDTLTFTASTAFAGQKISWTLPTTAKILNQNALDSSVVEIAFDGVTAGIYEITARGKSSCGLSIGDTVRVDVSEVPVIKSITTSRSLSCSDEVLSLKADVLFSNTYNWTVPNSVNIVSGQSSDLITLDFNSFSGDTATVYFSTQNTCNVSVEDSIKIYVPHVPPIHNVTSSQSSICSNTSILTASTDAASDRINWDLPTGATLVSGAVSDSTVIEVDFSNVAQGTYTITASSVSNCDVTPSATVDVDVLSLPSIISITPSRTLACSDETLSLKADAQHSSSYNWTVPTGSNIINGQGTDLLTLDLGTYSGDTATIFLTVNNTCSVQAIDSVKIYVPHVPPVHNVTSSQSTICSNTSIFTASTNAASDRITWDLPTGATLVSGVVSDSTVIEVNFSNVPEGTYTIKASSVSNCDVTPSATVDVDVLSLPSITSITPSRALTCSDETLSLRADAKYTSSYAWRVPSGVNIINGQGTGLLTLDLTNFTSDTATVYLAARNTCIGEAQDSIKIFVPHVPPITSVSSSHATICGNTGIFTASTNNANDPVNWTLPTGATIISSVTDSTVVEVDFTNVTAGNYSIKASSVSNCDVVPSASVDVEVLALPSISGITLSRALTCSDETLSLQANASNVSNFNWSIPSGANLINGQGTNLLTLDFANFAGDTATIQLSVNNGCNVEVTESLKVYVPHATPVHNLTSSKSTICGNTSIFTASTNNADDRINWTLPTGAVITSSVSDSTIIEVDFANVTSGTHEVKAASTSNCDIVPSASVFVEVQSIPTITSLTPNRELSCDDEVISFLVESTGGTDYSWSIPDNAMVISGQGTKLLTLDMSDVIFDSVEVSVTVANSCNLQSVQSVKVNVPTPPSVTGIELSREIYHPEDTVTMTASGVGAAESYIWVIPEGAVVIGAENEATIQYTVRASNLGDHTVSVQAVSSCGTSLATTAVIRISYDPTSLEDELSNSIITYPNPSKGRLSIDGISDTEVSIIIRDVKGRKVQEYHGKPLNIKLNKLTNGQYFIDIYSNKKDYGIHSFIMQK